MKNIIAALLLTTNFNAVSHAQTTPAVYHPAAQTQKQTLETKVFLALKVYNGNKLYTLLLDNLDHNIITINNTFEYGAFYDITFTPGGTIYSINKNDKKELDRIELENINSLTPAIMDSFNLDVLELFDYIDNKYMEVI